MWIREVVLATGKVNVGTSYSLRHDHKRVDVVDNGIAICEITVWDRMYLGSPHCTAWIKRPVNYQQHTFKLEVSLESDDASDDSTEPTKSTSKR